MPVCPMVTLLLRIRVGQSFKDWLCFKSPVANLDEELLQKHSTRADRTDKESQENEKEEGGRRSKVEDGL